VQFTTCQFDIFLPPEKSLKNKRDEEQFFTINTETNPLNNLTANNNNTNTINSSVSVRESQNLNNLHKINNNLREKYDFLEQRYNDLQNTYNEALEIVKNHQTFYYKVFQIFNKK